MTEDIFVTKIQKFTHLFDDWGMIVEGDGEQVILRYFEILNGKEKVKKSFEVPNFVCKDIIRAMQDCILEE